MILSSATRRRKAASRKNHTTSKVTKPLTALKSSIKQVPNAKNEEGKPAKKTISIGGIFKKALVEEPVSRHSRRHKRAAPEHDLFLDYQDNIAESRTATLAFAKAEISKSHTHLLSKLTDLDTLHSEFEEIISSKADNIFSSLSEEKVETSRPADEGSELKETVNIGKRLLAFKTMVETKKDQLSEFWGEWESVQKEIEELGAEVLGVDDDNIKEGGRKSEWELLELQFEGKLDEVEEDIGEIEGEFIEKMGASEREISLRQRNERNKLLAEILAADD